MICSSIDIGSDTIKIVVAKVDDDSFNVLASTSVLSVGIKKGIIIDVDLACKSINLAVDELEKQLGFRIDKAIINVPFYDVDINVYNGKCFFDDLVNGDDIITCFKSSVSTIDESLEVVTVFPIDFSIDGEKRITNPINQKGEQLECRMVISTIPKKILYPYLEVFEKCNIEVIDLSFGVVNDFYNINIEGSSQSTGAVIDIGNDKTEIGIFNKNILIKGDTLNFGSKLVDHDISYIYHLDKMTTRNIKENLAMASSKYADVKDYVTYVNSDNEEVKIDQLELSQIVEARLEEILKNVKKGLNNLTNREISYIIITGGISNMPGFDYLISNIFPNNAYSINMNILGVRNNIYTSCVGMIKYYYDKLKIRGINYTMYENISEMISNKKSVLHERIIDNLKKYCDDN